MRKKASTGRGRPPGADHSRADVGLLEYLAGISTDYGIDSERFFEKLVNAWKRQESTCKTLTIKCRKRTIDNAKVFLITSGHQVVAQFPIPEHILTRTDPLGEFVQARPPRTSVREAKADRLRIGDLRAGMKQINVKVRVLKIPEPRLVFTRFGSCARVANALVGDETGTIKLSLWNKQIDAASVGDRIRVDNAQVVRFRGELQLRVSRQGKLNISKTKCGTT